MGWRKQREGESTREFLNSLDLGPYRSLYYDRQGQAIGMGDWAELLEDISYKRVALTKIRRGSHKAVSTVWLGLDSSFGGRAPIIFESMVFNYWGRYSEDLDQRRYATEAEALAGHAELVEFWKHTRTVRRKIEAPKIRMRQAEQAAKEYLKNLERDWTHTNNYVDPYETK